MNIYAPLSHSKNHDAAELKLVFAMDIVRHADRTPLHYVPKLSDPWPESKRGNLTKQGFKHSIALGKEFNNYYIKKHNLLPNYFSKKHIFIKSTDSERTKSTTKGIMRGMYPDKKHVPFTVVKKSDNILKKTYPRKKELKKKYLLYKTSKETREEIQEILKEVNHILGLKLKTPGDFLDVAGILMVDNAHNIKLPKGFSKELVERILDIRNELILNRYSAPEIYCTVASNLAHNIVANIEVAQNNIIKNRHNKKYMLYVGHDTILMSLLNLMEYRNMQEIPPFLADIRFELFQSQEENKQFFVKSSFNGKNIDICSDEYCPLNEFIEIIQEKNKQKCG